MDGLKMLNRMSFIQFPGYRCSFTTFLIQASVLVIIALAATAEGSRRFGGNTNYDTAEGSRRFGGNTNYDIAEGSRRFGGNTNQDKQNLLIVNERMPLLVFGTYQLKGFELEQALDKALEIGYRHIDTASLYNNEEAVGNVLKKWFTSGKLKREDIYITTKFPRYATHDPKLVPQLLQESLQKLQVDYVDMYLIHIPFYAPLEGGINEDGSYKIVNTDIIGLWKEMEKQFESGKAKAIGLGNFNQSQILRIKQQTRIIPSVLQTELHTYLQEKPLVDFCSNLRIYVSAFSPLGTESLTEESDIEGSPLEDEVVIRIAKKHRKTPAQILLRFLYQQRITIIPISTDEQRLKEHFEISKFTLDGNDMHELKRIDKGENGRIGRFSDIFKGIEKHPEYPQPY